MKKSFTNILMAAVMLIAGISMTACSSSPDTISEREILKQVNDLMERQAQNVEYHPIQIGKFECNDDADRLVYRQLQEAGLVDYSVERFAWWERANKNVRESYRVLRQSWWSTYYDTEYRWVRKTVHEFFDHYVVNIELTGKGERLCVEALPEPVAEEDEDMKLPEENPEEYAWNKADLSEEWPFIPNPFLEPEKAEEPVAVEEDTVEYEDTAEYEVEYDEPEAEEPEDDGIDRIDIVQYHAYNKVEYSAQDLYIKVCNIEAVKARNIQIFERDGARYARAEVIISTEDVTDAGRILANRQEGERQLQNVEFAYYQDKGWVLCNEASYEGEY